MPVDGKPLVHLSKYRPPPQRRRRPTTPATATSIVEKDKNSTEDNNNIADFYKPAAVNNRVASPVTSSKPKNEKDEKYL